MFAIKTIRKSKVSRLDSLRREIDILQTVDHPQIIKVRGMTLWGGRWDVRGSTRITPIYLTRPHPPILPFTSWWTCTRTTSSCTSSRSSALAGRLVRPSFLRTHAYMHERIDPL